MANKENLVYDKGFDSRTTEEQTKIARKGGIASGKARKEKATMKKTLQMLLEEIPKIKGNEDGLTYKQLATIGLIKGSIDGKAENYKTMVQLLGELEEQTSSPSLNINIIDNSNLEKSLYEEDE